jgi:hypothetical protein
MKKVFFLIIICLISCSKNKDESTRYTYYDKEKKMVESEIKEKLILNGKDSLHIVISEKSFYKSGKVKSFWRYEESDKSRSGKATVEWNEYDDTKENPVNKIKHYSNLKENPDSISLYIRGVLNSIEIPKYGNRMKDDTTIKYFDKNGDITSITQETYTYRQDFEGGTIADKSRETKKYKNGKIYEHNKYFFDTNCRGCNEENGRFEAKLIFLHKYDDKGNRIDVEGNQSNSLRQLRLKFLDSRIEKVKMIYGNPDSSDVLFVGNEFSVFYHIYYDKIKVGNKKRPVVFFTSKDTRDNLIVDKIETGNYGQKVYWNRLNSIRLTSKSNFKNR